MQKPNWQNKFKNLPEIPNAKKWDHNSHDTLEQRITKKIYTEGLVTNEDEKILAELKDFYETLLTELPKINFGEFTNVEIEEFKNYIFYAFNYVIIISNEIKIFKSFRLIVNEWVTGNNESINHTDFLKYPPIEIVKKSGKYNRANTPNTNVLYTTENINTALLEIKPPLNKKLTVGIWKQKDLTKTLISYPLSHSDEAIDHSVSLSNSTFAYEEIAKKNNQKLFDIWRYFLNFLGREFTKPIKNNLDYLISSNIAERILNVRNDPNPSFNMDLIVYPSVGNKYKTQNYAIHPDSVNEKFELESLLEFEIEEEHYDYEHQFDDPFLVTVAKAVNFKNPKSILQDGTILW